MTELLRELMSSVLQGALDPREACQRAGTAAAQGLIDPRHAASLASAMAGIAADQGWQGTLPVAEIADAACAGALAADPEDDQWRMACVATAADLLQILHLSLIEHGSWERYLRASQVADRAMPLAGPADRGLLALLHGALILDCYTANRSPANYAAEFALWAGPGDWPEPLTALAAAEQRLREAVALVVAQRRGRAYKALAQLVAWQGILGGTSDDDELRRTVGLALQHLEPDDVQGRLGTLALLGSAVPADAVDDLLALLDADSPEGLAQQQSAWDAYGQAAVLLQDAAPDRALAVLARRRRLTAAWQDELLRARHFAMELSLFSRTADPAAAAVGALLASAARDEEAQAIAGLGGLPAIPAEHVEAARYLVASLHQGAAVNAWGAGDYDAAAMGYLAAARRYLELGLASYLASCVANADQAVLAGATCLAEATAWLAAHSLPAQAMAEEEVRLLAEHVLAAYAAQGEVSGVGIFFLLQVLKGRRYAAMLAQGTDGLRWDPGTLTAMARVRQAEAEGDPLRPQPFDAALGDDDILCAWVHEDEAGGDAVSGLQRTVERRLDALLTPDRAADLLGFDDIVDLLDERTALLDLYEGPTADGSLGSWQTLVTRRFTAAAIGTGELPSSYVEASWRGRDIVMPVAGLWASALRRAVQAWPGPLDVSPEAEPMLVSAGERYLRVVAANLDRLAGIDRLIIVPHGAGRFLPIHLAALNGAPLADRFEVRYLMNLQQLRRPLAPRRDGAAVFALSYADQPGLPALPGSAAEAHGIAGLIGAVPAIDGDATEQAFADALQTRRLVHLRAHGRMTVDAPSHHTVFLHPSPDDDGRFRAFEALPLDLAGLELVTLGACETALCRVDRCDNPRGLPAALFLAGAQSVIGTLWPVEQSVSTRFFTCLYRCLSVPQTGVVDAFGTAQRETRAAHPQYRDWGAFYLMGAAGDR